MLFNSFQLARDYAVERNTYFLIPAAYSSRSADGSVNDTWGDFNFREDSLIIDDAIALPEDDYYYTSFKIDYRSDQRKTFSYSIAPSLGKFYNGDKFSLRARLSWRLQPYFTSSIQINYDKINLPEPYPSASIWLIGPKVNVTFSKNIFWSTFIQYSSQSDNFSVNTRLQWRFAPLSDLYVVYNDNYFTENVFAPRLRSLNVKLTYWLNL